MSDPRQSAEQFIRSRAEMFPACPEAEVIAALDHARRQVRLLAERAERLGETNAALVREMNRREELAHHE